MKSLLCAIAKNENRYLEEWINHYKVLGFDRIILFDNNDIDGEALNIVPNEFVDVVDYRGKHIVVKNHLEKFHHGIQEQAYNDCYHNYSEGYDWIAYFDIDEFLVIDNGLSINEFLSQEKFDNADSIILNWKIYGDNGNIHYENKPVMERFPSPSKYQNMVVKTIVRTKLKNFISLRNHYADIINGRYVRPNGEKTIIRSSQPINYEGARLNHYYTKTIEEWIDRKYKQREVNGNPNLNDINNRLREFFIYNEKTEEKLNVIRERINDKLDQSIFKL